MVAAMAASMCGAEAAIWPFGKKNKAKAETTTKVEEPKKSKSKYEKLFGDAKKCTTAKGDFMTLHTVGNKIYAEMDNDLFGRDVLIATTISEISDPALGSVGYKPQDPLHCRFSKIDTVICLNKVTIIPEHKASEKMSEAVRRNNIDPVLLSFAYTCPSPDSTATVFEITPLFMNALDQLSPIKNGTSSLITTKATYDEKKSYLGEAKAFEDNVSVKSYLSFKTDMTALIVSLKKQQPTTVAATRTILLLPEEPAPARKADSRVGIFLSNRTTFDTQSAGSETYSIIHRWRVEPADEQLYAQGELVEPKKPIVFYLDDAFPTELRPAAKEGIERWNKAFEAIGFKNVVQVLDYPTDDPAFDPDNLKYSCVRWLPSTTENAMGPSWVDPRSGEIINASIIVYSDVAKLVHSWRFVQTSQVDESVRSLTLTPEVRDESWAYVLAHEMGHCLGFMHNMSASAAIPVEKLRDAEYTQQNGTTTSIMDYARFNYVAQPGDKGVKLTPPDLGIYDYWLIEYAYKPVAGVSDVHEEAKVLEQWVEAKSGDKRFRYGRQQTRHRMDPSAIEEDLSDDPIAASTYGVNNLKYITSHLGEWIGNDVDSYGSYREELYNTIVKQYDRYMAAVLLNVGGVYLTSTHAKDADQRAIPVSADYQRKAMRWAMDQIDNCEWISNEDLEAMFRLRTERADVMAYNHTLDLLDTYKAIAFAQHISPEGKAFTIQNWIDECSSWVWKSTKAAKATTPHERMKQRLYVDLLTKEGTKAQSFSSASLTSLANEAYVPSLDHIVTFGLDQSGTIAEHIEELKSIEQSEGRGSVAQKWAEEVSFGPTGYGWQSKVNTKVVDESPMHFYAELLKTKELLQKAVKRSAGDDKAHYQLLLRTIEQKLENK